MLTSVYSERLYFCAPRVVYQPHMAYFGVLLGIGRFARGATGAKGEELDTIRILGPGVMLKPLGDERRMLQYKGNKIPLYET